MRARLPAGMMHGPRDGSMLWGGVLLREDLSMQSGSFLQPSDAGSANGQVPDQT